LKKTGLAKFYFCADLNWKRLKHQTYIYSAKSVFKEFKKCNFIQETPSMPGLKFLKSYP